jgi:hypothetical protein
MPIDGKTTDLTNTCISIRQLYQQFRDIGVNALVFLDANHSQHLSLGGGIGAATARLAQEFQIPTFLSCQSHEFSHEDAGLGHGLFTTALLEALNYHPDLNLETIETYLTSRLAELSEHHWKPLQTPLIAIPQGVSEHRPVFSATTQSSISATIPEVVYTPPTQRQFLQEDTYAPYTPPILNVSIVTPESIGTGAIVKRTPPKPIRKEIPNWAKVSFLLTMLVGAGAGIFVFKSQMPAERQPMARPTASDLTSSVSVSAVTTTEAIPDLKQARLFIRPGDATSRYQAILAARKIPASTPELTVEVKQSIELWSQEIYQIAQSHAEQQHWQIAIDTARMIPRDAPNYSTAQGSMSQWQNKLSKG